MYITRFDDVTKRIVPYPIRKYINWNLYEFSDNSFPSGFLSKITSVLEEEYEIRFSEKPEKQYNFDELLEDYLKRKGIEKRYFQDEATSVFKEYGNGIIEIGTGGGKTLLYGNIVKELGVKTLIITIDLTSRDQTYKEFCEFFGEENVTTIDSDYYDKYPIVIANIQNCWAKRLKQSFLDYIQEVGLLIVNECHHVNENKLKKKDDFGNTWYAVSMMIPAYYRIGGTGTVSQEGTFQRFIQRAALGEVIYSKTTSELIKEGFATPVEVHVYKIPSSNEEHLSYVKAYENMVGDKKFNELISTVANKYANQNLKVLIFCDWVDKSAKILEQLLGDRCRLIYGATPLVERRALLKEFAEGKFPILIGTVFSEDFNLPNLDVGIIIGKKGNERVVNQRLGRVVRLFEGKKKGIIVIPYVEDKKRAKVKTKIGYVEKLVDGILARHSKEAIKILKSQGYVIIEKQIDSL
jgi:superfamily II DNA or RNA helicase